MGTLIRCICSLDYSCVNEEKKEHGLVFSNALSFVMTDAKFFILFQTKTRVQHLQDQYRSIQQGIAEFSASPDLSTNFLPSSTAEDQFSTRATVSICSPQCFVKVCILGL